jgi:hypothetical protein
MLNCNSQGHHWRHYHGKTTLTGIIYVPHSYLQKKKNIPNNQPKKKQQTILLNTVRREFVADKSNDDASLMKNHSHNYNIRSSEISSFTNTINILTQLTFTSEQKTCASNDTENAKYFSSHNTNAYK